MCVTLPVTRTPGQGVSKAHAYPLSFQVQAYAGITHAGAGETPAFPVGAVTLTPAPVSSTGQALSRQGRGGDGGTDRGDRKHLDQAHG